MVSPVSQSARCAILMIAAPSSGSGKTTLTATLATLHRQHGRRVKVFKCGADFIDPMLLACASGQPVDNLDLWMVGAARCQHMLYQAAEDNDLILIEAVMGLFDGSPSAADLAIELNLPVLAVIDASAMAQTFGALAYGLCHYQPALNVVGVFANKVASTGHAQMLQDSVNADAWQGYLMRGEAWPERHLGLNLPNELTHLHQQLQGYADQLSSQPIAQLLPMVSIAPAPTPMPPPLLAGKTVAVAQDAAFAFLYPANLQTLRDLGATVVFFSPLAHEPIPEADALWLAGGYPECHLQRLSEHPSIRQELQIWIAYHKPIYAECGGMLALCEQLDDGKGHTAALWSVLPAQAALQPRLAALGLQAIDLGAGELRGHTFHYSTLHTTLTPTHHAKPCRYSGNGEAVYQYGSLTATYFHAWFASHPIATAVLFGATLP
ncbi:MAG: hypothetical protein RLY58_1021 [Pseudomonadota bacterium]